MVRFIDVTFISHELVKTALDEGGKNDEREGREREETREGKKEREEEKERQEEEMEGGRRGREKATLYYLP